MKKSDKERLKKIVSTWNDLHAQMEQRQITPALLLEDMEPFVSAVEDILAGM